MEYSFDHVKILGIDKDVPCENEIKADNNLDNINYKLLHICCLHEFWLNCLSGNVDNNLVKINTTPGSFRPTHILIIKDNLNNFYKIPMIML